MLQGWLAPVICAELPQSEDRKSSIDSIMTTTRTCVFHVLLIFTVLFLTGCGGVGTSSGGSTEGARGKSYGDHKSIVRVT